MLRAGLSGSAAQRPVATANAIATPPNVSRHAQDAIHTAERLPSTKGVVNYMELPSDGTDPYVCLYEPKDGKKKVNFVRAETEVDVYDLRDLQDSFTLKDKGIELHKLEVPNDIDWDDEKDVSARYYPLVEKLLLQATGATRAHIFDHTLRRGHVQPPGKDIVRTENGRQQPVGFVHIDYTTDSGIDRLKALLPEEAEKLQKTPFAVIQVWRPLKGPVRSSPLGVIDVSTLAKQDLISYPLHFEHRTGYNFGVRHNPDHRWYYAKDMDVDEAYVFTCYDSRKDRARFTPHTGFRDTAIGPDAPPRESVELRSYCFWENEAPQEVDREL